MTSTKECSEFDGAPGSVPEIYSTPLFSDERGSFSEAWNRKKIPVPSMVAQINHSYSTRETVRGMHWQVPPFALGKYVTCLRGCIEDVVVDLRKRSATFGHWKAYTLMGITELKDRHSLWVPEGFAHGFMVLSQDADVMYLQNGLWRPNAERSFRFDDPTVGINWAMGIENKTLSDKDRNAADFKDLTDNDLFL